MAVRSMPGAGDYSRFNGLGGVVDIGEVLPGDFQARLLSLHRAGTEIEKAE